MVPVGLFEEESTSVKQCNGELQKVVQCEHCGEVFNKMQNLKSHTEKHHDLNTSKQSAILFVVICPLWQCACSF